MTFAVVTGAKGGLGSLIVTSLESEGITVLGIDKEDIDHRYRLHAIQEWKRSINLQKIDILVNCAGITSIDYLENLDPTDYYNLFDINCSSITWMVQELLPLLRGSTVCNILSTASNTPMTASIAYNASKAAAQMVTRQMARELKPRHDITVFGIAPNKLKGTPMSESVEKRICEVRGWSEEYAREYQLRSLPAGEETDPQTLAEFIGFLLSDKQRHRYLNGCIIPYGVQA